MKTIFPRYNIGHFINEPNNPTAFEITRFEEMGELDIEDPHQHAFYEILWLWYWYTNQFYYNYLYEYFVHTIG
jgi:hypothetical protein